MEEPRSGDACAMQTAISGGREVSSTVAIDEHTDLNAALLCTGQRFYEFVTGGISAKDVARQRDTVLRRFDGGQHFGVGVVTVSQYVDVISVFGRPLGDALPGSLQRGEVIIAFRVACRLCA